MILLNLQGGLGNQLFQYAAGQQLATSLHTRLYVDLSSYANDSFNRNYRLDHFNVKALYPTYPTKLSMQVWDRFNGCSVLSRLVAKVATNLPKSIRFVNYIEPHYHFDEGFQNLRGNVRIQGYFQSYRYFEKIATQIKDELTLVEPTSSHSLYMAREMRDCNSISVHVRRADYLTHSGAAKMLAVQSIEYYNAAITEISKHVQNLRYFVFSDDMEWCKQNLSMYNDIVYIEHNGSQRDYEDIWLMGQCKHHIIANSSFSWWGAWLGNNPDKIVIAPKCWFLDPSYDDRDLIPSDWQRL